MPEANPYAPSQVDTRAPPANAADAPSTYKLYSPAQIFWAAVFGTPITGMVLLAKNRRRLGHASHARTALLLGAFMTALLLMTAGLVPKATSFVAGYNSLSIWYYAHQDIGAFDAHLAAGRKQASSLVVVAIGVGMWVITTLLAVGLTLLADR